jgi:hypothetical protein
MMVAAILLFRRHGNTGENQFVGVATPAAKILDIAHTVQRGLLIVIQ